jgi:hypothetical protein
MTGLTLGARLSVLADCLAIAMSGGSAAVAMANPASSNKLRRVSVAALLSAATLGF